METVGVAKRLAQATASDLKNLTMSSVDRLLDELEPSEGGTQPSATPATAADAHAAEAPGPANARRVRVVLATAHPLYVEALIDAFERVYGPAGFVLKGVPVESAVARQPMGFDAILKGANVRPYDLSSPTPSARPSP